MPDFLIVAKLFLTEYIVDTLVKVKWVRMPRRFVFTKLVYFVALCVATSMIAVGFHTQQARL